MEKDWSAMNEEELGGSPLQRFYRGKTIFLTGGTGFLGKVLIEKLLRSTEVATIYILVREKKGKGPHTRIDELLDDVIFDRLKRDVPKYKHRVVGVAGDCSLAGLGLSLADRQVLVQNVEIVFHSAATVNFDEKLKEAFAINVNGTRGIIDLCRQIEKLKVFMHVSTAYANCNLDRIDEKFYECPVRYDDLETLLDKLTETEVESKIRQILGNWPNTYTFTKAIGESVIRAKSNGLPVGVLRPGIVTSSYKEPLPSWIDNLYGPTGVVAAVASGLLKTMCCNPNTIANMVPVDTCVAALIAAAWEVAHQTTERVADNVKIYNYVSTVENPFTWGEFHNINYFYGRSFPFSRTIWSIGCDLTSCVPVDRFKKVVYHLMPAAMFDFCRVITGKRPTLLKMYKKIHKFTSVIEYFCAKDWHFTNNNVQSLYNQLNDVDQQTFALSMRNVHWMTYMRTYVMGIRQYILKDPEDNLTAARSRLRKLEILNAIIKYVLLLIAANCVWSGLYSIIARSIA